MTRREWIALAAGVPRAVAAPDIDRFFEDFLTRWVREDPVLATVMRMLPQADQERLEGQLPDVGDETAHKRITLAREGLVALAKFDLTGLSRDRLFSAQMLQYLLDDVIAEEPFIEFQFPLNQFTGVQARLPSLFTDLHPLRTPRDAENYLSRLAAFGRVLDQASAAMSDRARKGILLPRFILVETVDQMKRFTAAAPHDSVLVASFAKRLESIKELTPAQRSAMAARAEKLAGDTVYPAYRRSLDLLASQQSAARDDAGLWRLRRGADAYAFYLHRYTTTAMTAQEIHRTGLDEVARLEGEMDGVLKHIGYKEGSVKDRMRKLADDNLYPPGPDVRARVLRDYERFVRDARERSLASFLHTPKAPCIVQRIPEFQEANAAANYQSPAPDGSRPGIFRVPLPGDRFSKVRMRTLTYHEAIPGHHFQLALQVEMTSLPRFRRSSPFGTMSAFSEGWGLYAERLASDLGWYAGDPVSDLGRLDSELFRARRLVVDTGIHAMKWTREQSIDYGIQRSEVDRYVVMPGQACSYKIGQLKMLQLRERARKQMGARFDLKQYHDVVLRNGSIPLELLEKTVVEWIRGQV